MLNALNSSTQAAAVHYFDEQPRFIPFSRLALLRTTLYD